jgi:cytoskeleton protein RodZ
VAGKNEIVMSEQETLSFGKYLKKERLLRTIPLEEIAIATKIKIEYLRAIEEDIFETLPNETFVKGYIRAYSKYCGLNEDEVLVNYEFFEQLKISSDEKSDGSGSSLDEKPAIKRNRRLIYFLLLLITLSLSLLFAYFSNRFFPVP